MRGASVLSLWSYNKSNSYNSAKDSLPNTQTHLRDLYMGTSEGPQIQANSIGERGEEQRWVPGMQSELTVGLGKGEEWSCRVYSLQPRGAERNSTFLPEWSAYTVAEPSNWGRDRKQRCSTGDLAAVARQKTKPQSLAASPHSSRASSGLQKKL